MENRVVTMISLVALAGFVLQGIFGLAVGFLIGAIVGIIYGILKKRLSIFKMVYCYLYNRCSRNKCILSGISIFSYVRLI